MANGQSMLQRDPYFETQLAQLKLKYTAIDEVINGAEWHLTRAPESGTQLLQKIPVYSFTTQPWNGVPPLAILYILHQGKAVLRSIVEESV